MRGGLPQKEPEILARWEEMDLYAKQREAAANKEKWILHDGPPYANGDIHMGHALNKILKDVVVKSYAMLGYNTPYVPGWDCHGLPIEWKIEEKYRKDGKDKDDVDILDFRAECRNFAQGWIDTQSKQFQRLGVGGDWENPYLTMKNRAESLIVREIHKFAQNGGLYQGAKPVMWSVVEKTALAEAEVEYKEHKSITIWIRFPIVKLPESLKDYQIEDLKDADVVIWTTTPWTMPSNRAIGFGKDIDYNVCTVTSIEEGSLAKVGDKFICATSRMADIRKHAKINGIHASTPIKGSDLEGTICAHPLKQQHRHPETSQDVEGYHTDEKDPSAQALKDDTLIYDFDVPMLEGDFVTDEAGTGFVHIAPSHGEDDFFLFLKHFGAGDIPDNVTDDGKFRDHVPLFAGLEVYTQEGKLGDGNFAVLKAMAEAGKLLAKGSLRHEYPHSWRSKAPIIFRTTPQWFISMDKPLDSLRNIEISSDIRTHEDYKNAASMVKGANEDVTRLSNEITNNKDVDPMFEGLTESGLTEHLVDFSSDSSLRAHALYAISKTRWVPPKGEARIRSMVANRPDWCISRQRAWGVPIALFVHKETDEILNDDAVYERIAEIFETESSDAWWSRDAKDFLGADYNADDYNQIFDIVDVWFESGSTHAFVVEDREDLGQSPADLYLEGSDQHRGWFHSSLLESVGTRGRAPYKAVLTHGFVLDDKGYKMSKSLGNVIDPLKMMDQYGADILRLWALTCDYSEDVRIGKDSLKNTGDLYRRIRNTLRFLLGALDGFTKDEMVEDFFEDPTQAPELEQLVLHQLYEMDKKVRGYIADYDFMKLTKALHDFCNEELSSFYFDIRKDRLYCDDPNDPKRKMTRSVMAMIYNALTSWLAPILVFTAEEAWSHRPEGIFDDVESVHLREFVSAPESWKNDALAEKWRYVKLVRDEVLGSIEPLRAKKEIGSSLEAKAIINVTGGLLDAIRDIDMAEVCITSQFKINIAPASTAIEKAAGEKCERCWKVLPEVESNGGICNRCVGVVKQAKAA